MIGLKNLKVQILPKLVAILMAVFTPWIHIAILWFLYNERKHNVDLSNCFCTCWDTIFKGPYEHDPFSYKHLYFNATKTTGFIWAAVVVAIVLFYEGITEVFRLIYLKKVRYSVLVLLVTSCYPTYFLWWSTVNIYNDRHHLLFDPLFLLTVAQAVILGLLFNLIRQQNYVTFRKLTALIVVSCTRIIIGCEDKFITNSWRDTRGKNKIIMDYGFTLSDVLNVVISVALICHHSKKVRSFIRKDLLHAVLYGVGGIVACNYEITYK